MGLGELAREGKGEQEEEGRWGRWELFGQPRMDASLTPRLSVAILQVGAAPAGWAQRSKGPPKGNHRKPVHISIDVYPLLLVIERLRATYQLS